MACPAPSSRSLGAFLGAPPDSVSNPTTGVERRVCGLNGPAKTCLRRTPGFLESKLAGLSQQVRVEAHGGLDGFGGAAKSHVDPRVVIGLTPGLVAHDFSQP